MIKYLALFSVLCAPALAQTVPTIPRSGMTGTGAPVSTAADVAGVFGGKVDTTNGALTNPAVTGGTINGSTIVGGNSSAANVTAGGVVNTLASWLGLLAPTVSSNAALKALAGGAYTNVNRAGFATAGDGGSAVYAWSVSACTLNSGAGDNGSQVAPTAGSGCWILQPVSGVTDIRVWGAKADNATDIAPFVQKAYAANVGCIAIPGGIWAWSSAVTMTSQSPCFRGDGWNEAVAVGALNTTNMTGTWIHFSASGFNPVTITATTGQGGTGGFTRMAFYEDQPTPGASWTPTAYPYIFTLSGNLGRIDFDNLMFYNVTHCINTSLSARGHITNIYGQPLGTCLQIDKQHDVSLLENVEFWPFWATSSDVSNYQEASVDPILYLRADSPTISNVFTLGYHSGIAFGQSSDGITTGAQITNFQGDADQYSVWIKPGTAGVTLQFGLLRTAGENWITNLALPSSEGYRDEGTNSAVDIANLDCFYAGANCVHLTGAGRVSIGNARLWNFNNSNVGGVGLQAGTSGFVSLANTPSVVNPQFSAPVIPVTSLGGIYAVRGLRQQWTPTVAGTTATGAISYTTQGGAFWYDGSLTTLSFRLSIASHSGFTGTMLIRGFPVTQNSIPGQDTSCQISSMSGVTLDANYTSIAGVIPNGLNQAVLVESGGGQPTIPLPVSDFTSAFVLQGTCVLAAGQ